MHTASKEWADRVAARNAVETAKAQKCWQPEFLWNGETAGTKARQPDTVALSAAGKEAE